MCWRCVFLEEISLWILTENTFTERVHSQRAVFLNQTVLTKNDMFWNNPSNYIAACLQQPLGERQGRPWTDEYLNKSERKQN